ncbi:Bug family tripartite tricarboxylate transporter substrate binding protein [Paracraurococcus ruber]|uniref:LacI family transcriptional regulator n=1 Tax=Paracraurococcus ruber TaxID=77675 RepID=A0ABS1D0X3_9PROT|nr:tripartite tricarboxylate transporter substrate binding protein [Paracraurococcus ruber]MBK1659569.1 LacI family transcriptional regulator [Paracraurococcus ruber]TDG31146.1 tripartite tricarboxylate transporter substrate binding protein [Paracraurococcus ruber]
MRRRALAAALGLLPAAAAAQPAWRPDHPVRLVVPFPPGGPTDLVARPLAQRLTEALGQPVLADNRGGAGGNLAGELVARAAPDGHTLLLSNVGVLAVNQALYRTLPFDPERDFTPVALVAGAPVALVVHPGVPARTVAEFVAWAKAQASPLPYASAGAGTPGHLAGELFRSLTGAPLQHAPYRGSAPALQDVVAGYVRAMFDPVQSPLPQIEAGRLRALAVSGASRSPALPAVPTLAEAGVAGHDMVAWWAVVGPAGLPAPVVARLAGEIGRIAESADWQERLGRLGISPIFLGPEALAVFRRREAATWGEAVRASGAKAE